MIEQVKEKGRKEFEAAVVKKLIAKTKYSDRKIALLVGVTEAFVRRIRRAGK